MPNRDARKKITEALNSVKVIDPHCHLNPDKPCAGDLADIILYHHVWIELVSAGMSRFEVTKAGLPQEIADPEMESFERVSRSIPYLSRIKNTTLGILLNWLLKDIYDFNEGLTQANLENLFAHVETQAKETNREKRIFDDFCGIEHSISVSSSGNTHSDRMLGASEALNFVNIIDGKNTPLQRLSQMEARYGKEIIKASDFRDFLKKLIRELPVNELKFLGIWILPYVTDELAHEDSITRILGKVRDQASLSHTELGSISYFGLVSCLEELRKFNLRTIQLIVGAEVLLPHRSITHWCENFCNTTGRIACLFEDFNFNISSASDIYTQDIAILAKHIPNISVAGYWWHTLYPFYIRKSLETRLDIIPANKIIAYFSDAYHGEWCYPKLKLVKQILGDILAERVEIGWYKLDTAIELIHTLFYDSVREIYHI